jgi:hypothetical protein
MDAIVVIVQVTAAVTMAGALIDFVIRMIQ